MQHKLFIITDPPYHHISLLAQPAWPETGAYCVLPFFSPASKIESFSPASKIESSFQLLKQSLKLSLRCSVAYIYALKNHTEALRHQHPGIALLGTIFTICCAIFTISSAPGILCVIDDLYPLQNRAHQNCCCFFVFS